MRRQGTRTDCMLVDFYVLVMIYCVLRFVEGKRETVLGNGACLQKKMT